MLLNSSHAGAQPFTLMVDCLANDMLLQTRPRSIKDRILIEFFLYNFIGAGVN